jgi:hypothetical protein
MHETLETHEHEHSPELMPVSLTMAILAVLVAGATLLGHRAHTEELLQQSLATDQWAFYQAKNIRRHNFEMFGDLLSLIKVDDMERLNSLRVKYGKELERYSKEKEDIQGEARSLEKERDVAQKRANRFDSGEGLLEVALVITSITLLTKRRIYWRTGIVVGTVGVIVALTGLLVH